MTIRTASKTGSLDAGSGRPDRAGHAAPLPPIPDPAVLAQRLEAWFSGAARDLPWRRQRSGYAALVSELMLQQTQVSRVIASFQAFMARFPTPAALAAADEDAVLAAWQGLGYYRRARLLHAAAKAVVERHGGQVPAAADALRELPGIGRYTAGAIASIVHGAREPIVDGNVLRVLSRVAGAPTAAGDRASEAWAWEQAARFVAAAGSPAAANEALMELGATVCTPAAPACDRCPLALSCAARAAGTTSAIPAPRKAAARRTVHWHALVDHREGGLLLDRRPERGLWARLWQPPTVESDASLDAAALARAWGAPVRRIASFVHVTSHRDVAFTVWQPAPGACPSPAAAVRVPLDELAARGLANASWRVFEAAGLPVRTPPSAAAPRRGRRPGPAGPAGS
jgi:A/G-specific adenine glycosylase